MKSFPRPALTRLVLTSLATLCLSQAALAQQVYRCGNSYSQAPCTGAVVIDADDPRTEAQRAEAKQVLASDKALAKDLEAARRKEEAAALAADKEALARAAAAHKMEGKKPVAKQEHSSKKRNAKGKAAAVFTATDGASKKKATKKAAKH
jgi:hypothetical protein